MEGSTLFIFHQMEQVLWVGFKLSGKCKWRTTMNKI